MAHRFFPIIYVHLGGSPAPHLIASIRQTRRAAPDNAVWVVVSRDSTITGEIEAADARWFPAEDLKRTEQHDRFVGSVRRRLGKKRGFWRFATERFFYIEEMMSALGAPAALHLESDNLIFFDPNPLQNALADLYPGIGATFWNDGMCIPGIVYFSSRDALESLTIDIAGQLSTAADNLVRWYRPRSLARVRMGEHWNDMKLLASYRARRGRSAIDLLPTAPPGYARRTTIPHAYDYSHSFDRLGMIFDSLTFGPALHGMDPRHHAPEDAERIVAEGSFVAPTDFDLSETLSGCAPAVRWNGRTIRLASLHNHAKAALPIQTPRHANVMENA